MRKFKCHHWTTSALGIPMLVRDSKKCKYKLKKGHIALVIEKCFSIIPGRRKYEKEM